LKPDNFETMIYKTLRLLFYITIRVFFRKYVVKNAERIPATGPLLLVANHPSTFMDPIVICTGIKRPIHFIAKGEAFRSKFAQWILPKFNIIPIYRKEHDPHMTHKNEDTFNKVYEILEKGGVVMIFPEGISVTDRILKKIKTGAARMALGAEAKNNFELDVKIIPFGLNFENPHEFRTDLLINVGEPISVKDYQLSYEKDSFKAVHKLRDEIKKRITELTLLAEDEEGDKMLENIRLVFKPAVMEDLKLDMNNPEDDYKVSVMISERVHYFKINEPQRFEKVKMMITDYSSRLKNLKLTENTIQKNSGEKFRILKVLRSLFFLVAGFPFYIYGLLNNYFPYRIPGWIYDKTKSRSDFKGAIIMCSGTFTFIIFYSLQIYFCYLTLRSFSVGGSLFSFSESGSALFTLIYSLTLPITGLFAFYYAKKVIRMKEFIQLWRLFLTKREDISEIILKRKAIITELEKSRQDFLQAEKKVAVV